MRRCAAAGALAARCGPPLLRLPRPGSQAASPKSHQGCSRAPERPAGWQARTCWPWGTPWPRLESEASASRSPTAYRFLTTQGPRTGLRSPRARGKGVGTVKRCVQQRGSLLICPKTQVLKVGPSAKACSIQLSPTQAARRPCGVRCPGASCVRAASTHFCKARSLEPEVWSPECYGGSGVQHSAVLPRVNSSVNGCWKAAPQFLGCRGVAEAAPPRHTWWCRKAQGAGAACVAVAKAPLLSAGASPLAPPGPLCNNHPGCCSIRPAARPVNICITATCDSEQGD
jgi:hypothetical protein